jgi:threonylcarbamoyladenosine tRNA methylthiotransferase CDKAL1
LRIYLESYGCTLNHGEARCLKHLLSTAGHVFVETPEMADTAVMFTCCVIGTTQNKMIKRAKYFHNIDKPLIVSGCMAVVERGALSCVHPEVQFLKPREITNINNIIDELSDVAGEGIEWSDEVKNLIDEPQIKRLTSSSGMEGAAGEFEEKPGESIDSIVPIATGCLGTCTYCITRLARGRLKSYPISKIVADVRSSVISGYYEVRLTAQDTGCFGYD